MYMYIGAVRQALIPFIHFIAYLLFITFNFIAFQILTLKTLLHEGTNGMKP
jgi:hypothetical protein